MIPIIIIIIIFFLLILLKVYLLIIRIQIFLFLPFSPIKSVSQHLTLSINVFFNLLILLVPISRSDLFRLYHLLLYLYLLPSSPSTQCNLLPIQPSSPPVLISHSVFFQSSFTSYFSFHLPFDLVYFSLTDQATALLIPQTAYKILTFLKCCKYLHLITSQNKTSNFRRYDKTNTDIHIIQTNKCTINILIILYIS